MRTQWTIYRYKSKSPRPHPVFYVVKIIQVDITVTSAWYTKLTVSTSGGSLEFSWSLTKILKKDKSRSRGSMHRMMLLPLYSIYRWRQSSSFVIKIHEIPEKGAKKLVSSNKRSSMSSILSLKRELVRQLIQKEIYK